MTDTQSDNQTTPAISTQQGHDDNFITIPLSHVPANTLEKVRIYYYCGDKYSLYKNTGLGFSNDDHARLRNSGIEYVYIRDHDFAGYAGIFDEQLDNITLDRSLDLQLRVRLIYESTIALANLVIKSQLDMPMINRIMTHCRLVVNLLNLEYNAMRYMVQVANHKDHDIAVHMANNCTLMLCFALNAGLSEKNTLSTLGTGALLQDIGKIYLPPELLDAVEPLNDTQRKVLHNHVMLGCKQLLQIDDLDEEILDIIKYHHERYDGSGYPDQVKGIKIPLVGQVAGLIDIFEAMISVRPYREKPMTVKQAIDEIEFHMADKFDKDLLNCFSGFVRYHLLDTDYLSEDCQINFEIASMRVVDKSSNPSGRRHEREYFRCPAKAKSLSYMQNQWVPDDIQTVTIYNMSRSGIGFLSRLPFNEGQLIQVIISVESEVLSLLGKCIRSKAQNKEWNTIGVEFLRVFTRSEFRAITDKLNRNARTLGYRSFD